MWELLLWELKPGSGMSLEGLSLQLGHVCKMKRLSQSPALSPQHALTMTHRLHRVLIFGQWVPSFAPLFHGGVPGSWTANTTLHTCSAGPLEQYSLDRVVAAKPTFKRDEQGVLWAHIPEMPY